MSVEQLQALLTVKQVAEQFGVPARVVRKAAKAGEIPGHIEVLGKDGFDPDKVMSWTPPEPGTRVVGAKRDDGRQCYHGYFNEEEVATLLAQGYEIIDPRVAAKERRAARKAAKAEGTPEDVGAEAEGDDNPFADFGA